MVWDLRSLKIPAPWLFILISLKGHVVKFEKGIIDVGKSIRFNENLHSQSLIIIYLIFIFELNTCEWLNKLIIFSVKIHAVKNFNAISTKYSECYFTSKINVWWLQFFLGEYYIMLIDG